MDYLPKEQRQTLLFSATQTRDVSSLATLSLRKPEYLGVHDKEKTSTPESLQQSYVVVPLEHKLNATYSFVKSHLKCKSIIFLASCSQVRHVWELFCSLRPGVPVMALHGKLLQEKRTEIYFDFLQRPHAVLFSTDIAARGLDFPNVDWVVQVDAPEDRDMYIHRVGRTARYRSGGKSLLILTPSEDKKGFIKILQGNNASKVPIKKLSINPTKTVLVTQRAASLVAENNVLQRLAKKAFQSYVRSIYLMPQKDIFDVQDLDLDGLSRSLGLASAPNVRFLKSSPKDRSEFRESKNVNRKLQKLKAQIKAEKLAKKLKKIGQSDSNLQSNASKKQANTEDHANESDDELLVAKDRKIINDDELYGLPDARLNEVTRSHHTKKIRISGSNSNENKHIVFTDDGEAHDTSSLLKTNSAAVIEQLEKSKEELEHATDEYMHKVRKRLEANKDRDLLESKQRVREKHKKRRLEDRGEIEKPQGGVSLELEAGNDIEEFSSDESAETSNTSEDDSQVDVEDMALSLIRGGA